MSELRANHHTMGRVHRSRGTPVFGNHNLATPSKDRNQATTREDTDRDLACATVIF
jgi:hypothetical protein